MRNIKRFIWKPSFGLLYGDFFVENSYL